MDKYQQLQQVFTSIRELNRTFYHLLNLTGGQIGITPAQYLVLKGLYHNPGIGLSELAEQTYSTNSTASGIIERMVRAGWVSRERTSEDRRSVSLTLTEEGRNLFDRAYEMRMQQLSPMLQLPQEDIEALIRIHRDIVQTLNKVSGEQK